MSIGRKRWMNRRREERKMKEKEVKDKVEEKK